MERDIKAESTRGLTLRKERWQSSSNNLSDYNLRYLFPCSHWIRILLRRPSHHILMTCLQSETCCIPTMLRSSFLLSVDQKHLPLLDSVFVTFHLSPPWQEDIWFLMVRKKIAVLTKCSPTRTNAFDFLDDACSFEIFVHLRSSASLFFSICLCLSRSTKFSDDYSDIGGGENGVLVIFFALSAFWAFSSTFHEWWLQLILKNVGTSVGVVKIRPSKRMIVSHSLYCNRGCHLTLRWVVSQLAHSLLI